MAESHVEVGPGERVWQAPVPPAPSSPAPATSPRARRPRRGVLAWVVAAALAVAAGVFAMLWNGSQSDLEEANATIEAADATIDARTTQVAELDAAAEKEAASRANLEDDLAQANDQLETANDEVAALTEERDALESELADADITIADQTSEISSLEFDLSKAEEDLATLSNPFGDEGPDASLEDGIIDQFELDSTLDFLADELLVNLSLTLEEAQDISDRVCVMTLPTAYYKYLDELGVTYNLTFFHADYLAGLLAYSACVQSYVDLVAKF